ncbi:hypothetical protein T484DRAFT_1773165 [Baffinella frigidus]|nr:hypothetical protein T484DRAFT_1773165 [Cryptophyta sp. CCMP2293]
MTDDAGPEVASRRAVLSKAAALAAGLVSVVFSPGDARAGGGYGGHDFVLLAERAKGPIGGKYVNPGVEFDVWGNSDKQVYYPGWLEGEWQVKSTYKGKAFPLGEAYVYRTIRSGSARSATEQIGDSTTFAARYLPSSQGKARVVGDRAFNTASMLNAYAGYTRVSKVEYDAAKDPTRMVMRYPEVGQDMRPLPPKRTEVFINNRDAALSPDGNTFASSEVFRAVTLGPAQSAVADSENAAVLSLVEGTGGVGSVVRGVQRSMVFLVGARAVAIYDYDVEMRRVS